TDRVETISDMLKSMETFSALSEADIRGVSIALENVMQDALANGKNVRVDKIGSLYPSLASEGTATPEEFNAQKHVRNIKVNYRPGKRLSDSMKAAVLQR